ncbi:unnamed protein product [Sphagnum tenellum]
MYLGEDGLDPIPEEGRNLLAFPAAQGQIIFVIVVWVQSWMSAPMPSIAGSVPSQITPLPGIGKYGYREYFYNHYAGVAALAGNERRQKDLKDEATQAESINCIAQRLAKMPSPLSSKWIYRMATVAEITNPMEEIDADVPEITGLWEQFD